MTWIADRLGARIGFETFVANIGSLWFPARDDVVCVLAADDGLMVLVVDHEELITLSRVDSGEHAGYMDVGKSAAGEERRVRD